MIADASTDVSSVSSETSSEGYLADSSGSPGNLVSTSELDFDDFGGDAQSRRGSMFGMLSPIRAHQDEHIRMLPKYLQVVARKLSTEEGLETFSDAQIQSIFEFYQLFHIRCTLKIRPIEEKSQSKWLTLCSHEPQWVEITKSFLVESFKTWTEGTFSPTVYLAPSEWLKDDHLSNFHQSLFDLKASVASSEFEEIAGAFLKAEDRLLRSLIDQVIAEEIHDRCTSVELHALRSLLLRHEMLTVALMETNPTDNLPTWFGRVVNKCNTLVKGQELAGQYNQGELDTLIGSNLHFSPSTSPTFDDIVPCMAQSDLGNVGVKTQSAKISEAEIKALRTEAALFLGESRTPNFESLLVNFACKKGSALAAAFTRKAIEVAAAAGRNSALAVRMFAAQRETAKVQLSEFSGIFDQLFAVDINQRYNQEQFTQLLHLFVFLGIKCPNSGTERSSFCTKTIEAIRIQAQREIEFLETFRYEGSNEDEVESYQAALFELKTFFPDEDFVKKLIEREAAWLLKQLKRPCEVLFLQILYSNLLVHATLHPSSKLNLPVLFGRKVYDCMKDSPDDHMYEELVSGTNFVFPDPSSSFEKQIFQGMHQTPLHGGPISISSAGVRDAYFAVHVKRRVQSNLKPDALAAFESKDGFVALQKLLVQKASTDGFIARVDFDKKSKAAYDAAKASPGEADSASAASETGSSWSS